MISKDDILKLETRRDIYNVILKNPGLHLREILRITNLPTGSLQYHLKYLEKYGLITSIANKKYIRYYIKDKVSHKEKKILNFLRQEIPRRIILMLLIPGPGHIYKDKKTQKEAYKKTSTFLLTYSKKEIIELTKHWKGSYDKDFFVNKHYTTVSFHLQKLLDADIIEDVKIGRENKFKLKDPELFWEIFIKYNDDLSIKSINKMLIWRSNASVWVTDRWEKCFLKVFPHPYHA